jgi:hypothetical protein
MIGKSAGSEHCLECHKEVHDLRGKSLLFIAKFVSENPGSCIHMGANPVDNSKKKRLP